jgi:asparagine synthase (glutamine-hydrolysing)
MCGINIMVREPCDRSVLETQLRVMERAQIHRGPDDQGTLIDSVDSGKIIGLGHQRLSILDTSASGHQPMISPCGRYALIFNGEVYNYKELACELNDKSILSISSGDTAVVLAALIECGPSALKKFNGMWSLAFYDLQQKILLLSRDRMGVKPLYYIYQDNRFLVASEIKAILSVMKTKLTLNKDTIYRYLVQGLSNSSNSTMFNEIKAFPPAHYLVVDLKKEIQSAPPFVKYWNHPFEIGGVIERVPSLEEIRDLFIDSVRIRLRSDVPVGVLLSGGIDSSSILAAINTIEKGGYVTALSAISDDKASSEEKFIDLMAGYSKCNLQKTNIDKNPFSVFSNLSETNWLNDQPINGLSEAVHLELMRKAKEFGIVVLLTGQGADEQLAGYNKFFYFYIAHCLMKGNWIDAFKMIRGCIANKTILSEFSLKEAKRYIPFLLKKINHGFVGDFLRDSNPALSGMAGSYQEREFNDLTFYSVPMLLHYEDRMSMASSREMRVPFLDYRLVEMFAKIPPNQKLKNGWTKAIFRDAMNGLLPKEIRLRKDKKGFNLPEDQWARTILRSEYSNMFLGELISEELKIVRLDKVRLIFKKFLQGDQTVNVKDIFRIYSFETWLRRIRSFLS